MRTACFFLLCCLSISLYAFEPIPLTLRNSSLKAISLEIPGVMNPTLSPMSSSGVSLKEGQKIYFYNKGDRCLLLTISQSDQGKTLKISALIKKRKRELRLLDKTK